MPENNMQKKVRIELSIGHLLVVWDVLANKLSGSSVLDELTEEERRAVWALEDMCENCLSENGASARPDSEWEILMATARKHIKNIPADFLD